MMSCNIFRSYFRLLSSSTEVMLNKLSKKNSAGREILFRMAKSLRCRLGLVLKPLEMEFDYHRTCSTFSQPFYFLLSSPTLAFLEAKWRLLRQFQPRHKSRAARRSEESRKSTVFVSSRAQSRAEQGSSGAEQSLELRAGQKSASQWLSAAEEIGLAAGFEHCTAVQVDLAET